MPNESETAGVAPQQPAPQAASGYISMGMIANTVPSFSGKENVREYFEKLKIRARLENWSEKVTIDFIIYRLTGEAYQFYKSESSLQIATITFTDFEASFIKKFEPISIPGEPLIKLSRCIQRHDEAVAQYVTRLKVIGSEILRADLATATIDEKAGLEKKCNELVLNQFKLGLRRELMKQLGPVLMRTDNLTMDKAEEYARQEELNEGMLKSRHALAVMSLEPSSSNSCDNCGGPNHRARDCLLSSERNQEGRERRNQRPNNYQSRSNQNFKQPNQNRYRQNARQYYPKEPVSSNYRSGDVPRYDSNQTYHNRNTPRTRNFQFSQATNREERSVPTSQGNQINRNHSLNANTPSFIPRLGGQ